MAYKIDDRNKEIFAIVDNVIVPREKAVIPVWDSGFLHGKQIWSSPRLINGKIFRLSDHLEKIRHGIIAMGFGGKRLPENEVFIDAIRKVLVTNKMQGASGVHIRIIYTPGSQVTASMNKKAIVNFDGTPSPYRIIVIPEWRGMGTVYDAVQGEKAILSQKYKRPSAAFADQTIHSNNQIHSSLACDEAADAGVAAAIMLDADGFLAETHASHIAIVKDGVLYTPHVKCCPPGVTRRVLLEICAEHEGDVVSGAFEDDIVADRLFEADEVMILGTMSGPIAITHVDNKPIGGSGEIGPVTTRLKELYCQAMEKEENLYDIFEE